MNSEYIASLLSKNMRLDGRKFDDYRKMSIETGVSHNAEGSARAKIGDTEVIAGVKLDVGEPFPDNPDEGTIIVNAELLALSNPEFELGPPDAQTIELARVVDRGIRESNLIDFKKLCIKEGEKVWLVFIDIYSINDSGNLQDAAFLASVAALKEAIFPKLKENGKADYKEHTKERLPLTKDIVECTLLKIGESIIVDPSTEEEKALDSRLTICVTKENKICAMQKGGSKGLKTEDIERMIDIALAKSKDLMKVLK